MITRPFPPWCKGTHAPYLPVLGRLLVHPLAAFPDLLVRLVPKNSVDRLGRPKFRLIVDLRWVNRSVRRFGLRMETVVQLRQMVRPGAAAVVVSHMWVTRVMVADALQEADVLVGHGSYQYMVDYLRWRPRATWRQPFSGVAASTKASSVGEQRSKSTNTSATPLRSLRT